MSDNHKLRILFLFDRGLTIVGRCSLAADADGWLLVRDARCVLSWGAAGDLAMLARNGPTSASHLSSSSDLRVRATSLVIWDCNEEAWPGK